MSPSESTVFLLDDDADALKGMRRLLSAIGYRVASFVSAHAFLEFLTSETSGCVLLDLAMPELNGLSVQELMAERGSEMPVVFVTGRADVPSTVLAMKAGAFDFLEKPVDIEKLRAVVDSALKADQQAASLRIQRRRVEECLNELTPRERDVLPHVLSGRLNKQIAHELGTVEKTIKVHRARIMTKMGVRSVAALVRAANLVGIGPAAPDK